MTFDRVVLIVLDGVGVGEAPDAHLYGDQGADTLGHVARAAGGGDWPNLARLGLGNIHRIPGVAPAVAPIAGFGRMRERSRGKDTSTGHWEMMGIISSKGFTTYPEGFPGELIDRFTIETGYQPLGNIAASGTGIIERLGEEHLATGRPILYTSVDSVLQIAAHTDVIPLAELYRICACARRIADDYDICRVIARPFAGDAATGFKRTADRHDYSVPPPGETMLDRLQSAGIPVHAIGKIGDIFSMQGIDRSFPSKDNADGLRKTLAQLGEMERGLLFVNLVDFDTTFGHRLDALGFAQAVQEFDSWLPACMAALSPRDLLIICADHGCDPETSGTDHTREEVPLICWSPALRESSELGCRSTFADIGATLGELFGVTAPAGTSFLRLLS